jgi:sec-independent protein translocase protein TatA
MPFHPLWLVVVLVVVLIIFGPGRLPELGGAVGKAMKEFRKATSELTSEMTSAVRGNSSETPAKATSTADISPAKAQESTSSSDS